MFRIGFRSRLVCLLGIGMAACATAAEPAGTKGSDDSENSGLELDANAAAEVDVHADTSTNGRPVGDPLPGGDSGLGMGQPGSDDGLSGCDGASNHLPGITIRAGSGEISLALPNIGVVTVKANGCSCRETANGLYITGNVAIDLGSGTDIVLLDADLDVTGGVNGGLPDISGTAKLAGHELAVALPGASIEGNAPVSVSLDTDVEVPGSTSGVALDVALKVPSVTLPSGDLPALSEGAAIIDADVVLATDGSHELVAVWGTVDADVDLLASAAPVALTGALDAHALIANGELLSVKLDGKATAATALNPALSAGADADIKARIAKDEFYIRICASAVADVDVLGIRAHADADATICLALTPVGPHQLFLCSRQRPTRRRS